MAKKQDPTKIFEAKFASGRYISPQQLEDILKNDASAQKPMLRHEEYMWLKQNHPEYTAAYEKDWSPTKEKIILAAVTIGEYGLLFGAGYWAYRHFFEK